MEIYLPGFGIHTLPPQFGDGTWGIPNLQSVDLSDNQITELPSSFSDLDDLTHLNLDHNNFDKIFSLLPPDDPVIRLSVFFKGLSKKQAKESLKRLKMSREEKRRIENTVDFLNLLSSGPKSEKWTNEELRRLIDLNQLSVETSINIIQASNSNIKDFLCSLEILRSTEDLISFEPLLTAQELMDLLNIEPGPLVGEILSWLKEMHLRDGTISIDEEKKMVLEHWKK